MVINDLIWYGDVGMPSNEFDGKHTPIPCGNRKQPQKPVATGIGNPFRDLVCFADELIHRRIHTAGLFS